MSLVWRVEFTDEFGLWWEELKAGEQDAIDRGIGLIAHTGPSLGRPHVDSIKGSRHGNLKELRVQQAGKP